LAELFSAQKVSNRNISSFKCLPTKTVSHFLVITIAKNDVIF
jgi:hypothetical protein